MKAAVIGAGLAGLATARSLARAGVAVTVFEARDRIGGRVSTRTLDGFVFEAGAEWVDADHDRVIALAREARAELMPQAGRTDWFVTEDGRCFGTPETADHERLVAWLAANESRTVMDGIRAIGTSPLAAFALAARIRSDEGLDANDIPTLQFLDGQRVYAERGHGAMSAFRLAVGCTALCEHLSRELCDLRLGYPVEAIQCNKDCVDLLVSGDRLAFDRCVVAVPAEHAVRLAASAGIELPLPPTAPVVKAALRFARPFWEDHGWNGCMLSDGPAQQTWPTLDGNLLMAYICGREATRLSRLEHPVQEIVAGLDAAWPGAAAAFQVGGLADWVGDPWSRCGFSAARVAIPASGYGPLVFAGEQYSAWYGFMEGALESAERAAQGIIHAKD